MIENMGAFLSGFLPALAIVLGLAFGAGWLANWWWFSARR